MSIVKAPATQSWDIYKRLLAYVKEDKLFFFLGLIGFGIYALSQTGAAWWLQEFIDVVENRVYDRRNELALLIIVFAVIRSLGILIGNYCFAFVARRLVNRLRTQLFDHLMVLSSYFYQQHTSSQLLARLTYNAEQVTGAATNALKILIREGLTVLGLFIYMLYLNWKLTLFFMLIVPVIGIVVNVASKRLRRLSHRIQNSVGDISHAASEVIKGYQVVRIFGGREQERARFIQASEKNQRQYMKLVITESLTTFIQVLVALIVALLTFLVISPSILESMTTGALVAFIGAAAMMTKPIRQLTEINTTIQKGIAAAHSFFDIFDEAPETNSGTVTLTQCRGSFEFNEVCFRYTESSTPVLQNITLSIKPGETVALVGKSGSGKSTLVSLIPRFFDYQSGEIILDGMPLSAYTLQSLRQNIALVNQQIILFEGSIADNIAYGELARSSKEAIQAAAEAARVTEFSDKLDKGLDTLIGENGLLLSGGQRQRIAIARAMLKNAPILILDEATSALDTESERHIQSALEHVMHNRTTFIIAHRLSTVENADKILVMENGRIVECGSHAELLQKQGLYTGLHRMQFSESKEAS